MILTVTAHAALDRVIFIDEFVPTTNMRSTRWVDCVGGKGFDTSVALCGLGAATRGLGFVAGPHGEQLAKILAAYGMELDLIWVEGDTRIAHVLVETRHARHSHVTLGVLPVPPAATEELLRRYRSQLPEASWVAAAGSLAPGMPGDFYRTLVEMAHAAGKRSLIDATGQPLAAVLAAPPTIVKLNREEFAQTFAVEFESLPELIAAARHVHAERRLTNLVLTCGRDGVVAVTPAGVYHVLPPRQQAVNAAGAGDATSAALVWRLEQGDDWPTALRWAGATGAAAVLTAATAEVRLEDVRRLLPEVQVETLAP